MSRFSIAVLPHKPSAASGPRFAEALFYLISGTALLGWASTILARLLPKLAASTSVQTILLKNSGTSMLIFALALLAVGALIGGVAALRSKSLPAPAASVLLITVAALRTLEILNDGSVSLNDANVMAGLFAAAALLYYGPTRLWWTLLMPLAVVASFSPLIWFEFYKGASSGTLINVLKMPAAAFAIGSLLIALRELRARANANQQMVAILRLRGENTKNALRAMESDLKNLRSILSGEATEVSSLETTEFSMPVKRAVEPSEASSVEEIDLAARRLLDEARAAVEGRPVKLSLTAPMGTNLPIAVRGSIATITSWMKSAALTSIESLGGFPDGAVRISIRPGLSALQILIEDNGRGFSESILSKMGQSPDRVSITQIREGVERLGGRFDLQARLGVGSRLLIELPRVDAFANSPRAPRVSTAAQMPSASEHLH